MSLRLQVASIALVLVGSVFANGAEQHEGGYWWNEQPESYKLAFVEGYSDAMAHAIEIACVQYSMKVQAQSSTPTRPNSVWERCLKQRGVGQYDFSHMTIGQVVEGVDDFYKDFRNKAIDIQLALDYVRDELKGKSPDELERELKILRSAASTK